MWQLVELLWALPVRWLQSLPCLEPGQHAACPPCLQPAREASLALARLPQRAVVGAAFAATLRVQSHVDRTIGPLKIAAAPEAQGPASAGSSPSRPAQQRRSASASSEAGGASRESSLHAAQAAGGGGASGSSTPLPRSTSSASAAAAAVGAAAGPGSPPALLPPLEGVCLDGAQAVLVDELPSRAAVEVRLQLRALSAGQLALPALALTNERDGRLYATLPPVELFVDSS